MMDMIEDIIQQVLFFFNKNRTEMIKDGQIFSLFFYGKFDGEGHITTLIDTIFIFVSVNFSSMYWIISVISYVYIMTRWQSFWTFMLCSRVDTNWKLNKIDLLLNKNDRKCNELIGICRSNLKYGLNFPKFYYN